MTPKRFIYLPALPDWLDDPEAPVTWCDWPNDKAGSAVPPVQCTALHQIPEAIEACQLYLILPGESVTMTRALVPEQQVKHLEQTLPFLLEEQLAADIELMHIVRDRHSRPQPRVTTTDSDANLLSVPCLVIEQSLIAELLQALQQHSLQPDVMTTDCLCLPLEEKGLTLAIKDRRCLLRSAGGALTTEISELSLAAEGLHQLATELDQPLTRMDVYFADATSPDSLNSQTRLAVEALQTDLGLEVYYQPYPDGLLPLMTTNLDPQIRALNLLQGPFAPPPRATGHTGWQNLAKVACLLFALHLSYTAFSGWYLNHQADALYLQSEALYREYFPQDKRIINLRTQVESHLRRANRSDGNQHFLRLLGQLGRAWQTTSQGALAIRQIRFDRGTGRLTLDIDAPAIANLDSLRQALSANGLEAELLSANETESGVRGRLQLRNTQG